MTISLAAITVDSVWMRAAVLAVVGISITVAVYGAVAAIVKADVFGLLMAKSGRLGLTRALGRGIVHWMPTFLFVLTWVGTAAMLWVGGQVVVHGLGQMGWHGPEDLVHGRAVAVGQNVPAGWVDFVEGLVTAACDGVLGFTLGMVIIPVANFVIAPIYRAVRPACSRQRDGGKRAAGVAQLGVDWLRTQADELDVVIVYNKSAEACCADALAHRGTLRLGRAVMTFPDKPVGARAFEVGDIIDVHQEGNVLF